MRYRLIKSTPWGKEGTEFKVYEHAHGYVTHAEGGLLKLYGRPQDWPEYFEPIEEKSDEQKLKEFMYNVKVPNDLNTFLAVAKALLEKGLIDRTKL